MRVQKKTDFIISIRETYADFNSLITVSTLIYLIIFQLILNMRKSCHEQNRRILQAYELYQKGEYNQSINIYQSILEKTSNKQLRFNLLCTISVISSAIEILQYNIYDVGLVSPLVKIRYYSNLCFLQIIMGFYDQSLNTFKQIKEILEGTSNFSQLLSLILTLFFRVPSLEQLEKQTGESHNGTLLQAFYMLNLAFAKEVCGLKGSEGLLKAAYPIFIEKNKIELGLVCVRQLLLSPIGQKDVEKYEKQLSKIISMEGMQNYQLDNAQSFHCCKLMAQQLVSLSKQLNLTKNQNNSVDIDSNLWKLTLKYEHKKILVNSSIGEQQRGAINKNINMMLKQSNHLVISQMKRTDFYANAQREIYSLFSKVIEVSKKWTKVEIIHAFKKIQIISNERQSSVRKMNRNKSQNTIDHRKQGKQNILPAVLTRDRSAKSLIDHKDHSNSLQTNSVRSSKDQSKIKLHKMIKFCQYGSFLSKRNFNSDGGEYRFVRVTQYILKWAKNPQKIQDSSKFIPLKDIRAITYGKCTPNLLKQSNHLLKQEYCFSLKLYKRTLDFYCQDFEQVSSWVCGLSQKLKQVNPNLRGYSMGKILWKRMFFILKQNFIEKLKKHQRHYYYQTAHSIILFGKNGFKLPSK